MTGFMTKVGLGAALLATTLTAAAPAEAQRWRGGGWGHHGGGWGGYHHYRGGGRTSAALLGGIVGLGVGAAIASSARPRYYNDGYYNGYYAPPRAYYRDSYYDDYRPRCWTEWRYDPYYGDRQPVRVCN